MCSSRDEVYSKSPMTRLAFGGRSLPGNSTQAVAAIAFEVSPVVFCAPGRPRMGIPGPLVMLTNSFPDSPNLVIFPPFPAALAHFALTAVVAVQMSRQEAIVARPLLPTVIVHFPSGEVFLHGSGTDILVSPVVPKNCGSALTGMSAAAAEHES